MELILYSRLSVGYHDVWQVPSPIEPFHGPVTPVTKWNKNENRRNYRSLPHIAQERVLFKEELCELSKFMLRGGVQRIRAIGCDSTVQFFGSEQLNFSRRALSLCLLPSPQRIKSGESFVESLTKPQKHGV